MSEDQFKESYLEKYPEYGYKPLSAYDSNYFKRLLRWKRLRAITKTAPQKPGRK